MDDTSTPPPNVDPVDPKKSREIQKLDLEITKLKKDVTDSQRSYLWRNPQVIPTAIAALGAIIGLGVGLYSNYFTTLKDKADLDQKLATVAKDQADQERKDADEAKKAADFALEQAKRAQSVADETMRNANQTMHAAEKTKEEATRVVNESQRQIKEAQLDAEEEIEVASFQTPLHALVQRGGQAVPQEALVSPLIRLLAEEGPHKENRRKIINDIIKSADTPGALKASLLYVLLKGDHEVDRMEDLGQLLESAVRSNTDSRNVNVQLAIEYGQWTLEERTSWLLRYASIVVSAKDYQVSRSLAPKFQWWANGSVFNLDNPPWKDHRDLFLSALKIVRDQAFEVDRQRGDFFLSERARLFDWIPTAGIVYIARFLSGDRIPMQSMPNGLLDLRALLLNLPNCGCPLSGDPQQWKKWLNDNSDWVKLWEEPDLETLRNDAAKLNRATSVWRTFSSPR